MNILLLRRLVLAFVVWTLTTSCCPAASSLVVADTDTTMEVVTMNPTVATTVAGDLATTWRRFAGVTIVQPVEVPTLTDPRLLPTRRRLFRRSLVLVVVEMVVVDMVAASKGFKFLINNKVTTYQRRKVLHFPQAPTEMRGLLLPEYFIIIDFFPHMD